MLLFSSLLLKMCKRIYFEERAEARKSSKQTGVVQVAMPASIPKSRHLCTFNSNPEDLGTCGFGAFAGLVGC